MLFSAATALVALAASPVLAVAPHRAQGNKRHAGLAAARRAQAAHAPPARRTVALGKRADGSTCKARHHDAASAAAAAASSAVESVVAPVARSVLAAAVQPAATSSFQPAATSPVVEASSAPAPSSSAAEEAPSTTEAAAYVAPTSWAAEATSTSEAWVAPAATSSAAPAPAVVSNDGSVKKVGLAWPNGESDQPKAWADALGNSWYYTWSPWKVDSFPGSMEFVPMLWGWKQIGDWQQNVANYASWGVKNALFVNEPNGAGQANVDPSSACTLWREQFAQLRNQGIRLGSAAPDSAPSGKQWLIDFNKVCPDAQPDFYVLHWYDVSAEDFQRYVMDFVNTFQKPIWVTEYACQNFNGGAQCTADYIHGDFFTGSTGWLASSPHVERFSAFSTMQDLQGVNTANSMMNPDGSPNALGWRYAQSC